MSVAKFITSTGFDCRLFLAYAYNLMLNIHA